MKRPLIGVLLVLAMMSWAGAQPYFEVNSPRYYYPPGSTIQIDLYDTGRVIGMEFDAITDTTYPSTPLGSVSSDAFASGWTNTWTTVLNDDDLLVEWMGAAMSSGTISGKLYSFDYVVPNVMSDITITTYNDGYYYYPAEIDYIGGSYWKAPPELTLTIPGQALLPEPASMLLLGLGGLLLRRRK